MKIHCLIENSFSHPNLVSEHGLSLLIEACGKRILFDTGASPAFAENAAIAEYECQFIAATQLEDGSWDIPWRWEKFPDEWAISKNWWKGEVILENLLYLKGFGKL